MDQVVTVLKSFEMATQMLSGQDLTNSCVILIVTLIIRRLETTTAERGVMTFKHAPRLPWRLALLTWRTLKIIQWQHIWIANIKSFL